MPKAPAKPVKLELVKPETESVSRDTENQSLTLRNPLIPQFTDLNQIGEWLKKEVASFERVEREATLHMVRIGMVLVWVEKTQPRGTQATLLRLHFGNKSEERLKRYISAAKKVMRELGMLEGNQLTDEASLCQVVQFQPDLFDDSETLKHNEVLRRVSAFIGEKSLSKLLEDGPLGLGNPEAVVPKTPQGHQKESAANRPLKTPEMIRRDAFSCALVEFRASFLAKEWHFLYLQGNLFTDGPKDTLTIGKLDLEAFLESALKEVKAHNKEAARAA